MNFRKTYLSILSATFALGVILFPVMALAEARPGGPDGRSRRLVPGAVASPPCFSCSPWPPSTLSSWFGWHATRRHEGWTVPSCG